MKKISALLGLSLCGLLCLFLLAAKSDGQTGEGEKWGLPIQGLQMSISAVGQDKIAEPEFQVALRNIGEKDVTLNLGMMLANGKVQLPTGIRLILAEPSEKERELHFAEPNIAGRVDDYVVPLRVGSMYTLKLKLNQFWSPNTKETRLKLETGRYQVSAQFQGSDAKTHNTGSESIALMNFWRGKLQSNVLSFRR
jgi:hypothetical protein